MEQHSQTINELATALAKAQSEMKPAVKDADNPFFKSKYADLATVWESIRNPLSKNGLCVSQLIGSDGNVVTVETVLMHTSGQFISGKLSMTAKDPMPQSIASASTYARRYGLSAIVGVSSEEDDDGAQASGTNGHKEVKKAVTETIIQKPVSLKDRVMGTAKPKFKDEDAFKAWRIDNSLIEDLEKATETELNYILAVLRNYEPLNRIKTKA